MRYLMTAALLITLGAPAAHADRLLMCGNELMPSATQLPSGLPSNRCSEIKTLGEGIRGSIAGPPRIEPASVLKSPDANSLRLRQAALEGVSLGRVSLFVLRGSPGNETLTMQIDYDGTLVSSLTGGASKAEPVETAVLVSSRTTWSVWLPAAPPGTPPTGSFCWDTTTIGPC